MAELLFTVLSYKADQLETETRIYGCKPLMRLEILHGEVKRSNAGKANKKLATVSFITSKRPHKAKRRTHHQRKQKEIISQT